MSCDCNNDRIEMLIKQGEQRSYVFNITDKDKNPVDLSSSSIEVQIKTYPLYKVKSLYDIILDTNSSEYGYINNPTNGQFTLTITEDISGNLPPKEYYIIITMVTGENRVIISGEGQQSGRFIVNKQ